MNGTSSDAGVSSDQNTGHAPDADQLPENRCSHSRGRRRGRLYRLHGRDDCPRRRSVVDPASGGQRQRDANQHPRGQHLQPAVRGRRQREPQHRHRERFLRAGKPQYAGHAGGGLFGPLALGGASGNGNVTQINILSFNIFNPQLSVNGGNYSNNTTVSNVAVGNGNYSDNSGSSGGTMMFGGSFGNGNTRQVSLFSGNIFNPQFSLFGDNYSNNTAVSQRVAVQRQFQQQLGHG